MADLPIYDAAGGSLVSIVRRDDASPERFDERGPVACAIVVVVWGGLALMGFNVARQTWELPGGSLEAGESAHDAARRELAEETGIRADNMRLVALADLVFGETPSKYLAAVFAVERDDAPVVIESDELARFGWWDPKGALWDAMSPLDAEIVRRCRTSN